MLLGTTSSLPYVPVPTQNWRGRSKYILICHVILCMTEYPPTISVPAQRVPTTCEQNNPSVQSVCGYLYQWIATWYFYCGNWSSIFLFRSIRNSDVLPPWRRLFLRAFRWSNNRRLFLLDAIKRLSLRTRWVRHCRFQLIETSKWPSIRCLYHNWGITHD